MAGMRLKTAVYATIGTLIGVLVTFPALRLAGHGDGWGIGDPVFLPLLYPYAVLMFLVPGVLAFTVILVLCVCQFPIYGLILGDALAVGARRFAWTALSIGAVHSVATAVCALIFKLA